MNGGKTKELRLQSDRAMKMAKQVPHEKELLEILELARNSEQKLKEACKMAESMSKKYQGWYEEATGQKRPEQPTIHYE